MNQYVAVVEPPVEKGVARVKRVKRTGPKLLSPEKALERARRFIEELRLGDQPKYFCFPFGKQLIRVTVGFAVKQV